VIERAQHVVERDKVDAVAVRDRRADDVAAGAPAPVDPLSFAIRQ